MKSVETTEKARSIFNRREPYNFMLNLGIFSIGLFFLVLSFLYFIQVRKTLGANFHLPKIFWVSSFAILLSSFTFHRAIHSLKAELFFSFRLLLGVTMILGFVFVILQLFGWRELLLSGIYLQKSLPAAYLYLISGLHILHIIGGLFFLISLFFDTLKHTSYVDAFVYSVNPPNQLRIRLIAKYWHFVDILWICLFLLFVYHHF